MNCIEYKDKIPLHALGELPEADRDKVENHLRVCPVCRAEYEGFLDVIGMYDADPGETLEPMEKLKLENNILRGLIEVQGKAGKSSGSSASRSALIRLATALLIFFAGFTAQYLMGQFNRPQKADIAKQTGTMATISFNQAPVSGLRFSSYGLKAIAHGKGVFKVTP